MIDQSEMTDADMRDGADDDADSPLRDPALRMPTPKPGSTEGTRWTEGQYAARGWGRISLRLPQDTLDLLDEAAETYGQPRWELIDEALRKWLEK